MTFNDENDQDRLNASERASELLEQMTLREKSHQLTSVPPWYLVHADGSEPESLQSVLAQAPGHICNFGVDDPKTMAMVVGTMQQRVVQGTRLGIPLLIHAEALNGFLAGGHMVFPTPTGLAATWSPDLVEEMASVIRTQMKRVGVRQALSPNMDIALDPRWGRTHETYGEDPYLAAAFSVAYTRGLQSENLTDGVIATAKHFIGYGMPQGGMNLSAYEGGPRLTRDLFAYPFEAAIQLAGLASVMNSYADTDGVPSAASPEVLTKLLRETLGFKGFVSSDYTTLQHIVDRQRAAGNAAEAAALTIRAGLDTEFPTAYGYGETLAAEVEAGRIDVADVNRSAHRILTAKFALGLFENPYPQESIDLGAIAQEGKEISRELANRSVVLAKNDGILPLSPDLQSIAVIGPHADAVKLQFPTYSYPAFREMTVFMSSGGMGNMVGMDPGMITWNEAVFSPATTERFVRDELEATSFADALRSHVASVTTAAGAGVTSDLGDDAIAAAVKAADEADQIVLALGGASLWFNGERTEGEASDSADVALPASQRRLVEAVAALGKPMIVVMFQGRAYTLPPEVRDAAAIVIAPYGGPFGPSAVADVLFGTINPSGKLPYSVPLVEGQIPVYHHQRAGTGYRNPLPPDVSQHYLDARATPLYTFGHGLSYTSFTFSALTHEAELETSGSTEVCFEVTNVGEREGTATPQLYLRVNSLGVTRPAQQLAGFTRVDLQPGETKRVTFELPASLLGHTALDGRFSVAPGAVDLWVGNDAEERAVSGRIEVTGQTRELASSERSFLTEATVHG